MSCQGENHLGRQQLALCSSEASGCVAGRLRTPQSDRDCSASCQPASIQLLFPQTIFIRVLVHIQPPDRAEFRLQISRCKAVPKSMPPRLPRESWAAQARFLPRSRLRLCLLSLTVAASDSTGHPLGCLLSPASATLRSCWLSLKLHTLTFF